MPIHNYDLLSDNELVALVSKEDDVSKYLYNIHQEYCLRFIMKAKIQISDAEDIYQDATIIFLENAKAQLYKGTWYIRTYLCSVCYNLMRKRWKDKIILVPEDYDHNITDGCHEDNEVVNYRIELIEKELNKMRSSSNKCYEILYLSFYEKFSMGEIAEKLHYASPFTASNKKSNCLSQLKKLVQSKLDNESSFN